MLERSASRLRVSERMPSYITEPSVYMHRRRARINVDFPDPVRPTAVVSQSSVSKDKRKRRMHQYLCVHLLLRGRTRLEVLADHPMPSSAQSHAFNVGRNR